MTTILTARDNKVLAKTIRLKDGNYIKTAFDDCYRFDLMPVSHLSNIGDLSELLTMLEGIPASCLVRGEAVGPLTNVRRTLYDNAETGEIATLRAVAAGVSWVMLDFDHVPVASHGYTTNEERLAHLVMMLPSCFHDAAFHYQWSSSAGLDGWDYLSCHLCFWLSEPWHCLTLRERFREGDFKGAGVDASLFTPNQVHYTAAPIFDGCDDPIGEVRSGLVRGTDSVVLPPYVKPMMPKPEYTAFQHNQLFPNKRLDELLGQIGPGYHAEISRAIAHYASVTPPDQVDRDYIMQRVVQAIHEAPQGKSPKRDYLDRQYLMRSIKGAFRKFGRTV